MMCKSVSFICCIFLAVVIANVYSKPYLSTGSDLHDQVNRLATKNPKSTAAKGLGAVLDARHKAMVFVSAGDTLLVAHRAVVAVRHSCDSLGQAALAFIKAHIAQVMASQGWADVVYKWHEEVMEVTRMLFGLPADSSTPATGDSRISPTTQPPSHHTDHDQTPGTAAPFVTCSGAQPPDSAAISALRSLPAEEKASRLIVAAVRGAVGDVAALLSAGADVGAEDWGSNTALHWAAELGHLEVARCLLGAGADVEARNRGQSTPLHYAAFSSHTSIVRLLLAASADPDVRGVDGNTPLHDAAARGCTEAAAALLEAGADRGAQNDRGYTPLDLARSNNQHRMVDFLA